MMRGVAWMPPLTKECHGANDRIYQTAMQVEDELIYYLYGTDAYPVEALALSDYNHLRCMLGLKPVKPVCK